VPYTSCHSSQPKGQKELWKLGFWGEKEMMGVGPNSFDTNKQTNKQTKFYQLLTYLLHSTYSRVLNFFIITLLQTLKFLTYTSVSFSLLLYITFLKHFFY
jgi:hypothetical protein